MNRPDDQVGTGARHDPVKSELVCYDQDASVRCILLEDDRPAECIVGPSDGQLRRQDILLGQVRQVVPALNGAFIDIGTDHDALLPLAEAPPGIKAGQSIVVQIKRISSAGKGHQVSTRIELAGPYAVLIVGRQPKRRSKLRALPAAEQSGWFDDDLGRLEAQWSQIHADSQSGRTPRRLYETDPLIQALDNWLTPNLSRIRVDGDALYRRVLDHLAGQMPWAVPRLERYRPVGDFGLAAVLGLTDLAERLVRQKIWLDDGGFIWIDLTEALTVIDVNSGKDTHGRQDRDLRLRTNLQAAPEISRQLRLRNIGGMIVIDFLRIKDDEGQQAVADAMRAALRRDRAPHRLLGYTSMGLFEMTRTAI